MSDIQNSVKLVKFHEVFDSIILEIKNCNSKEMIEILKSIIYLEYIKKDKVNEIVEETIDKNWN